MQRLSTVLLAILAVIVFGGAVYVIGHNDAPATGVSQQTFAPISNAPTPSVTRSSTSTPTLAPSVSPPSSPSARKPVVVFLGDDWTSGVGASTTSKRFSGLLSDRLDVTQRNLGQNNTGYAVGSKNYSERVAAVVAAKPDVVVISGGRNDVVLNDADAAASDAATLFADLAKQLPDARIIAVAPLWGDSDPPADLATLAAALKTAVTKVGGIYLDIADPINGHPEYMADDAHPNDGGYQAIADALAPKLKPLLNK